MARVSLLSSITAAQHNIEGKEQKVSARQVRPTRTAGAIAASRFRRNRGPTPYLAKEDYDQTNAPIKDEKGMRKPIRCALLR